MLIFAVLFIMYSSGDLGCTVNCWLSSFDVSIAAFRVVDPPYDLDVVELTCHVDEIGTVTSEFLEPLSLNLTSSGVSVKCSGTIQSTTHKLLNMTLFRFV
jgi:hypothetical protein